jgi:hypothetical protein
MTRADEHPFGLGSSHLGQPFSPLIVGLVANLTPIDGHDHDGCLVAQEYKTMQFQGVCNGFGFLRQNTHASMVERDCYIDLKVPDFRLLCDRIRTHPHCEYEND